MFGFLSGFFISPALEKQRLPAEKSRLSEIVSIFPPQNGANLNEYISINIFDEILNL